MKTRIWIAGIFGALLFAGCEKISHRSEISYNQEYTVTFNKTDAIRSATAQFKARGTAITLNSNSYVKAGNRMMVANTADPTLYTWSDTGFNDVNFTLLKNEEKVFFNTASYTDIKDVAFMANFPGSFNRSAGITFSWFGDITSDSSGTVTIAISGRDSTDTTRSATIVKTMDINTATFTTAQLAPIKNGNITITLSRTKQLPPDSYDGTGKGHIIQTITGYERAVLK